MMSTIDSTFNSSSPTLQKDISGAGSNDDAHIIIPDHRGNYYIYGRSDTDSAAIRISPNGTLDTSYGTSGVKTVTLTTGAAANDAVAIIDAYGQLLLADTEDPGTDSDISLTYDYILDPPTFGNCDYTSDFESTSHMTTDEVVDAAVTSTDEFYIVGWSVALDDSYKDYVALKSSPNGKFDESWGDNGYVRLDTLTSSITAHEAISLNNDELIIAGVETGTDNLLLAKFDNNGELASSFDSDGIRDFAWSG